MPTPVDAALIAGTAGILGTLITGTVALLVQRSNQKAELRRREIDAEERARTRFHEARLRVYAEFLEAVSKDGRIALRKITQERQAAGGTHPRDSLSVDEYGLAEHSAQITQQLLREVQLIAMSAEVREAAEELMSIRWGVFVIDVGLENFHDLLSEALEELQRKRMAFIEAAHREIAV
ncbi:hypothetical protein Val02_93460 [Virgisporangium aliadipatigenens]|uniref:Uncharacterized protein n=1 Tax=Virgisporangium aliadipatigenens TaxID=741659 RepID=A0A8J3YZD3_9ACTN|nr:hypothetical protein [Virgisporangium aliadipatigenens]GIJ52460.1 hypothetical protein Val02_93460 [Virgisporangium aliadipatigenens]